MQNFKNLTSNVNFSCLNGFYNVTTLYQKIYGCNDLEYHIARNIGGNYTW